MIVLWNLSVVSATTQMSQHDTMQPYKLPHWHKTFTQHCSLALMTKAFSQSGSSSAEVCLTSLIRQQNIPLLGFMAYNTIHHVHIYSIPHRALITLMIWLAMAFSKVTSFWFQKYKNSVVEFLPGLPPSAQASEVSSSSLFLSTCRHLRMFSSQSSKQHVCHPKSTLYPKKWCHQTHGGNKKAVWQVQVMYTLNYNITPLTLRVYITH